MQGGGGGTVDGQRPGLIDDSVVVSRRRYCVCGGVSASPLRIARAKFIASITPLACLCACHCQFPLPSPPPYSPATLWHRSKPSVGLSLSFRMTERSDAASSISPPRTYVCMYDRSLGPVLGRHHLLSFTHSQSLMERLKGSPVVRCVMVVDRPFLHRKSFIHSFALSLATHACRPHVLHQPEEENRRKQRKESENRTRSHPSLRIDHFAAML